MKYRLKDRNLQARLDQISLGDFSKSLDAFDSEGGKDGIFVTFGTPDDEIPMKRFSARFRRDELQEVPPYDPTRWNVWPDVDPPDNVPMQVEVRSVYDNGEIQEIPRFVGCAVSFCGSWTNVGPIHKAEIVLFRPWQSPDLETLVRKKS